MNISSRCEYALRAMIELGRHEGTEKPITATIIAERWGIPEKYLVHILLQLKRAGFVRSVRGAQGGYLLGCSLDDLTLFDIVQTIDGPVLDPLPITDEFSKDLKISWDEVAEGINHVLRQISLRTILDNISKANMYHI